jgi:epoxyqueuosine reductase QueG
MATTTTTATVTKDDVRARARDLGIDLVGFCRLADLEAEAPDYDKPSKLSAYLKTLIVLGRRYPTGVAQSPDDALRQFATGRTARHLEEAAALLAYWLEERDSIAAILSAMIPDLRRQPLGYSAPAGQGSLLLRQAAVKSGLGSLGLNQMLLTPEFGPRLFLAGVVTDLAVTPDAPFEDELCPGLEECGRCAAVCPELAIPLEARAGAPLAQVRAIDHEACARSSQPYGPAKMVDHLETIFSAPSAEAAASIASSLDSEKLWFHMTVMRQGAFTGCARCELVCPVGEDWPAVAASPARQRDLPREPRRHRRGDLIQLESLRERAPSGGLG